jgi:alanyl-tRNA synthetase
MSNRVPSANLSTYINPATFLMLTKPNTFHSCLLNTQECRHKFLLKTNNIYETISPDSLISESFPSSFTSSAGPNLASKFLLFEENLTNWNQAAVIQPCLRYWDIENAGDRSHLSFFEMATKVIVGGDRWQTLKEIFQLIVDDFNIDRNKIWITFYNGGLVAGKEFPPDLEAVNFWQSVGIPKERIVPVLGTEGFVANRHEAVGGYRTELYVERFEKCIGKCSNCCPGSDECGRFTEVVTSVTYEFAVDLDKTPPIQHVGLTPVHATGFGIERAFQVVNDWDDISCIDTVALPRDAILMHSTLSTSQNKDYLRQANIAADHLRGLVFLAAEGADQLSGRSNRGRRWIINRYAKSLQRAISCLGVSSETLIIEILPIVANVYNPHYPELMKNLSEVQQRIDRIISRVSD